MADVIILTDIYAAREKDPGDISSKDLMLKLQELGNEVHYYESFDEIENFILEKCTLSDLLITMGAGDVVNIENLSSEYSCPLSTILSTIFF